MSASPSIARWVRPALGAVAGLAVLAVIALAPRLDWPEVAPAAASVDIAPPSAGQTMVCPGDLLAPARDSTQVAGLSVAAPQAVVTAGEGSLERRELSSDADGSAPLVVESDPGSGAFAAAGSSTVADSDLAGLSAAACRVALLDSWLVAGAAVTESADFVLLANPGEVAATVTLTVYGASGPEVPPGGSELVVRPGEQVVVSLAGLALGEESPVIHVQATGAPVAASVQSSITRTLDPGGVDQAGAIADRDTTVSIVGVAVTEADAGAQTGLSPTVVRLLSPDAESAATVTVRAVGQTEPAAEPTTIELPAGIPTAVELTGLAVGTYVIEIDAAEPIVAGVWQTTGFGAGSDFAWYEPSTVIDDGAVIAVPEGSSPTLTIANPGAQEVVLELAERGGITTSITIAAGSSTQVSLRASTAYELTGGPVTASVGYAATGALAAFPVEPSDSGAASLVVFP